jgi:peptidoglycan/xylan/chitin deacetylase (PgdA/CDA1 family)/SAM-dependent methyltransferase
MKTRLSVLLPVLGPDRVVTRAVNAVLRQTFQAFDVVVVHDAAGLAGARRRLSALEGSVSTQWVAARSVAPGVWRNDGVAASQAARFVVFDGAEDLDADYLNRALAAAETQPQCAFVGSTGPFTPPLGSDGRIDLAYLLASPWSVAGAAIVTRSAHAQAGGFDESLPDLVHWDLLLTTVAQGQHGCVLPGPAAARFVQDDVHLREALRAERYLPSVRRIVAKHRESFERYAPSVLAQHDGVARRLWSTRGRERLDRREALRAELAGLEHALAAVREKLAVFGRTSVEWNDLRRTTPLSRNWGLERGRPVDRHYIEGFLADHAGDVEGAVLEVLDAGLTTTFGGTRVHRSDVLDIDPGNERATVIADLRAVNQLPADTYDCFILTQTLHLLDDMPAAIAQAYRTLKPGGVLLVTFPTLSMLAEEYGAAGDHWRVTEAGARYLFESVFPSDAVRTRARGNVLAATAFLYGLACDELRPEELDVDDPAYPLIITVRAVKPPATPALVVRRAKREPLILLYHQVTARPHDVHGLAVAPEVFRGHLQELTAHWHPMSVGELAAAAASGDAPDGAVALTFDDGYLDNLLHAGPLLREFGVPATFFLTSEPVRRRRWYWWDILEATLLASPDGTGSLTLRMDGELRRFDTSGPTAARATHDVIHTWMKGKPPVVRDDILRQLPKTSLDIDALGRPMDGDEMIALAGVTGATIGAHTVHHPSLPELGLEQLHREVFECRATLERLLGSVVDTLAYPFGDVSPTVVEMARAADYRLGVTTDARPVRRSDHPLRLPRVAPPLQKDAALGDWLRRIAAPAQHEPAAR